MLIEFTVENFRSIKEPVTLSAVAAPQRRQPSEEKRREGVKSDEEIASAKMFAGRDFALLPALAIYGPNASGKSNVLAALDLLLIMMYGGTGPNGELRSRIIPFLLDTERRTEPTRFSLHVACENAVYTYTLDMARESVHLEQLEYLPVGARKPRLLFRRQLQPDEHTYAEETGKDFAGPYVQLLPAVPAEQTAMGFLCRLDIPVLTPLKAWVERRPLGVSLGYEERELHAAVNVSHKLPAYLSAISEFVRLFDTGITRLEAAKIETLSNSEPTSIIKMWHSSAEGEFWLPLEEASLGTQRLFALASRLLLTFKVGGLLLVDELGTSLHPQITHEVIRMFQSEKINPKRAQLIFTSHDNTLLRHQLLRRDQLWFTSKRIDGSTELYGLSDFKERNDAAVDRAYLAGRYGAIPILPTEVELAELMAGAGA